MTAPLKLAIIGFGKMGQRHMQKLQNNDNFEVVAIVDTKLPDDLPEGVLFSNDYRQVSKDKAEAVLISSPSSLHAEMGLYFLAEGFHIFMEKPLALDFSDCQALVSGAEATGVVLMVGMVERFNPAFVACRGLLGDLGVVVERFSFERFNPTSEISDSDVILDLLIHDLDLLCLLVGDLAVESIEVCDFRFGENGYDFVDIILRFVGGVEARLSVGRGSGVGEARRICVGEWGDGLFRVDFMGRELVSFVDGGKNYGGDLGGDALEGEHGEFYDLVKGKKRNVNELPVMNLLFEIRRELDIRRHE